VPSQTLAALCGSRISAAHLPHGLCLTPLYLLFRSPVSPKDAVSLDGVAMVEGVAVVGNTRVEADTSSVAANDKSRESLSTKKAIFLWSLCVILLL
jgi:hypothetical protein